MVVRWQVFDPDTDDTWVFPINPREGAIPAREKNVSQQTVSATDSTHVLLFEGADTPKTINWSGTILSQAFYEAMDGWFDKRRQVHLTDDLGQSWWVYLVRFKPSRLNRHNYPWAMTYEAECLVIDWPSP